jgi:hypothetical protein
VLDEYTIGGQKVKNDRSVTLFGYKEKLDPPPYMQYIQRSRHDSETAMSRQDIADIFFGVNHGRTVAQSAFSYSSPVYFSSDESLFPWLFRPLPLLHTVFSPG